MIDDVYMTAVPVATVI